MKNEEECKYIIDTPQFNKKNWKSIAKECNINNVQIICDSENCAGIELADIVCGCFSECLKKENKEAISIY